MFWVNRVIKEHKESCVPSLLLLLLVSTSLLRRSRLLDPAPAGTRSRSSGPAALSRSSRTCASTSCSTTRRA